MITCYAHVIRGTNGSAKGDGRTSTSSEAAKVRANPAKDASILGVITDMNAVTPSTALVSRRNRQLSQRLTM